jgi:DNA-binding MarR family transcriptional regulator
MHSIISPRGWKFRGIESSTPAGRSHSRGNGERNRNACWRRRGYCLAVDESIWIGSNGEPREVKKKSLRTKILLDNYDLYVYSSFMNDFEACPTEGALGLLALLIKSGRFAETRLDQALDSAGLTFVKWRMLDAIVKAESPVSLGKLAEHLNCVKSNITQLTDRLVAEGTVMRVSDPEDRRSILMELTDSGRSMHKAGLEALGTTTQALFASSNEEQRNVLRHLLEKISERQLK